jgi:hypothetical protein
MMGTRALTLLLLALVGVAAMLGTAMLQPVSWVQAVTADGTRIACGRVSGATPITLTFTHSMFGGYVDEHYRLRDGETLERVRIVTERAAAAEYYATDGMVRRVDDGYEVIAPPYSTDRLVIRVDARGDHRLTIGETRWPLYRHLGASTQVTLEVQRDARTRIPPACDRPAGPDTEHAVRGTG